MNPRFLLVMAALLAGTTAGALDLGGLSRALKDPEKLKSTATEWGKALKPVLGGIGPEEEKMIGDAVALEVVGKYGGLVRDEAILQRVNLVGRSLARYSQRPELNWRFGVLNSDTVNAFSAPDGYVFITHALYALADNDDILAAILAHEIAHITGKHALNIIERDEAFGSAKRQVIQRSGEAREAAAQVQQVDGYLGQMGLSIGKAARVIMESGFDSKTEYGADLTGRNLALTTGYAPGGLRTVLIRLQQTPAGNKKIFSTHPPLAERLRHLPADPEISAGAAEKAAPAPGRDGDQVSEKVPN